MPTAYVLLLYKKSAFLMPFNLSLSHQNKGLEAVAPTSIRVNTMWSKLVLKGDETDLGPLCRSI